jgi:hypothetical protein
MNPGAPQAEVLLAIGEAKGERTKLLNDGLAGIQLSIGHLRREHNSAILDQAKLNATFASRDEFAALVRRADGHETRPSDIRHVMDDGVHDRKDIRATLETIKDATTKAHAKTAQQQLNRLTSGITGTVAATAGYLPAHFIK